MKYLPVLFAITISLFSCQSTTHIAQTNSTENKLKFEPNEEGEYDIIVFDPQYDIFIKTNAQPKTYYAYEWYKTKNRMYILTWNQRNMMPSVYDPNLYAVSIDLDPTIDYGLDFEYKLYQFFKFIEWKYNVRLM